MHVLIGPIISLLEIYPTKIKAPICKVLFTSMFTVCSDMKIENNLTIHQMKQVNN